MSIANLIDRIAIAWINRRYDQTAEEINRQVKDDMTLHKASIENGHFEATMVSTPEGQSIAFLLSAFSKVLGDAPNYIQFDMLPRLDHRDDRKPIRVTIQWAAGMSPGTKNHHLVEVLKGIFLETSYINDETSPSELRLHLHNIFNRAADALEKFSSPPSENPGDKIRN